MNNRLVLSFTLCISLATIWFVAGFMIGNNLSGYRLEVQQICDRSRVMNDGAAEMHCGFLQDKYGIEYLCESKDITAYCWTEVK